jgi:hypothetical protein
LIKCTVFEDNNGHGPAPSDLSCDIFLSVTHLFYRIVVNTFESRYNLVLISLVKFLESEELANSSWEDETAFPPNNAPSFVVTTALTVHVMLWN